MCRADQIKATEEENDLIFLDVIRKINISFGSVTTCISAQRAEASKKCCIQMNT